MELTTILPCLSAIVALLGALVAFLKGIGKRKATKNLTQVEQEEILRKYMISECVKAQHAVKYLRKDIPKDEVSKYKHNIVMEKITMYAMGSGYTWYNEEVWSQKLTDYIKETKEVQA